MSAPVQASPSPSASVILIILSDLTDPPDGHLTFWPPPFCSQNNVLVSVGSRQEAEPHSVGSMEGLQGRSIHRSEFRAKGTDTVMGAEVSMEVRRDLSV